MSSERLRRAKLGVLLLLTEVTLIVLFVLTADYEDSARPPAALTSITNSSNDTGQPPVYSGAQHVAEPPSPVAQYYAMFQDVHVMMFIGFGFLMTFLRRYGYSSLGLNMLLAAVALQWAMLVSGFLHGHGFPTRLGLLNMLTADFASAAVLITMGALLGKVSAVQLLLVCLLEIVFFTLNEWIGLVKLQVVDVGGSMFVHAFGAYFGLAVSRAVYRDDVTQSHKAGSVYQSDLFAMIGTLFLWLFWPSFNSALAVGDGQQRAVLNTYLALAASCVVTFAVSSLTDHRGRLDMVHVQNATLAGGVAVGSSADLMIGPHGALIIGSLAGLLSVLGFRYVTPALARRLKIHDTCGVHNLHGMPAVLAAVCAAVAALLADRHNYGYTLYLKFPARAPSDRDSAEFQTIRDHVDVGPGLDRSAAHQAAFQIAALGVTVLIAVAGGLAVGLLIRCLPLDQPRGPELFEDEENWEMSATQTAPETAAPLLSQEATSTCSKV